MGRRADVGGREGDELDGNDPDGRVLADRPGNAGPQEGSDRRRGPHAVGGSNGLLKTLEGPVQVVFVLTEDDLEQVIERKWNCQK